MASDLPAFVEIAESPGGRGMWRCWDCDENGFGYHDRAAAVVGAHEHVGTFHGDNARATTPAGKAWEALAAERDHYRGQAEKLLARNNELARQLDEAQDRLQRADPLAHVDREVLCERLSSAARRLERHTLTATTGSPPSPLDEAIAAMTDAVRVLEGAGR